MLLTIDLGQLADESKLGDSIAINGPPRTGDIMHSWADISLAKQKLGFEPQVDFVDGLEKTVKWYENLSG